MAITLGDGVVPYLDASAGMHNGHGSAEFIRLLGLLGKTDGFVRVTKQAMAEHFGVSRHTMDDWISRYNNEHAQDDDRPAVQ